MFYRINIWTRTSEDRAYLENVGRQFKYGCLSVAPNTTLSSSRGVGSDVEFTSHHQAQSRGSKSKGWTI